LTSLDVSGLFELETFMCDYEISIVGAEEDAWDQSAPLEWGGIKYTYYDRKSDD
jgi:hypothetical protein